MDFETAKPHRVLECGWTTLKYNIIIYAYTISQVPRKSRRTDLHFLSSYYFPPPIAHIQFSTTHHTDYNTHDDDDDDGCRSGKEKLVLDLVIIILAAGRMYIYNILNLLYTCTRV